MWAGCAAVGRVRGWNSDEIGLKNKDQEGGKSDLFDCLGALRRAFWIFCFPSFCTQNKKLGARCCRCSGLYPVRAETKQTVGPPCLIEGRGMQFSPMSPSNNYTLLCLFKCSTEFTAHLFLLHSTGSHPGRELRRKDNKLKDRIKERK